LRKSLRCRLFDESLTHDGLSVELNLASPCYRCEKCKLSQITE
jgi:hypothetical protein